MGDGLLAVLIYVLGLGLLFLELFIPSGGILGIVGCICTIYGIIQIFSFSIWVGIAVVLVTIAYVYMILRFWSRRVKMTRTGSPGSSPAQHNDSTKRRCTSASSTWTHNSSS